MLKISVFGKMREGKDTAALIMQSRRRGMRQIAYGDALKLIYHTMFGESEKKPRAGYQWFGQAMRSHDADVWVNQLQKGLDYLRQAGADVVVTDMRQPNEYKQLTEQGFYMVRVRSSLETRLERMRAAGDDFKMEDLENETEQYIDSFPYQYEIINDGTFEEFEEKVLAVFEEILADYRAKHPEDEDDTPGEHAPKTPFYRVTEELDSLFPYSVVHPETADIEYFMSDVREEAETFANKLNAEVSPHV